MGHFHSDAKLKKQFLICSRTPKQQLMCPHSSTTQSDIARTYKVSLQRHRHPLENDPYKNIKRLNSNFQQNPKSSKLSWVWPCRTTTPSNQNYLLLCIWQTYCWNMHNAKFYPLHLLIIIPGKHVSKLQWYLCKICQDNLC